MIATDKAAQTPMESQLSAFAKSSRDLRMATGQLSFNI